MPTLPRSTALDRAPVPRAAPRIAAAFVIAALGAAVATPRLARADSAPPVPAPAPAEDEVLYSCHRKPTEVAVTFKPETDVKDLIAWMMGFSCKAFLLDPRVVATGKKVTLIVPTKLAPADAYRLFLSALATINLTVVARGGTLRVVESAAARREALPIARKGMPDDLDQIVRYVIKPVYVQPETLRQAYTALKSDAGDVALVGSLLLVTDYGSHLREMLQFTRLIDVPGGSDGIYTIPVQHADATKLAERISQLLSLPASGPAARPPGGEPAAPGGAVTPSKILVDDRTNTLLVAASEAAYQRVKALVERLDIALDIEGGASIHVYPLGSAIAEELAKTLTAAIGDTGNRGAKAAPGAAPPGAAPGAPSLDTLGATLEGQARVIADKSTNALIVMASGHDYLAIKELLRQLDQPRRQVFIEAMILEVDVANGTNLGTVSHAASPIGGSGAVVLGGIETASTKSFGGLDTLSQLSGLAGGVLGESINVLGRSIPSYAVLFQALANQSNVNVLSSPSIVAVDNEQAKYKIGTTIPYWSGVAFAGFAGGSVAPGTGTRSIDHKELPLTLDIKPHISADDSVLLEISHTAMDLVGTPDKDLGPTWSTRSIDTRVVVRDQETVVIGGLMQERESRTTSKVPILGDIPLIGYLFKTTDSEKRKTNLLVMLTPYIIKGPGDLQAIRARKQREHDEFARSSANLEAMHYEPTIDYRKKRGLIEEINRAIQTSEDDAAERKRLVRAPGVAPGPVQAADPAP